MITHGRHNLSTSAQRWQNERLRRAIPIRAWSRQITALDTEPTRAFPFISPIDNTNGSVRLNAREVENIGRVLRDLGIAPNSFSWKPDAAGPYPGLRPLMEGDEAQMFGRNIEIRDGLKALEGLRESVSQRALVIQAPAGAGKSSLLRAGRWRRLRRHPGFTPGRFSSATCTSSIIVRWPVPRGGAVSA
jgi:hypothetical protein